MATKKSKLDKEVELSQVVANDVQNQKRIDEVIKKEVKEAVTEAVKEALDQTDKSVEEPVTEVKEETVVVESEVKPEEKPFEESLQLPTEPIVDTPVSKPLYDPLPEDSQPKINNIPTQLSNSQFSGNSGIKSQKNKRPIVISTAIILAILAISVLGMVRLLSPQDPLKKVPTALAPKVKTPTSISPTPAEKIKMEDIKIQVLNGSGVAGQASSTKDSLTEAGFSSIEIGNVTTDSSNDTTVTFTKRVSKDYQKKITTLLEQIFTNVVADQTASQSAFDVTITTGIKAK